MPGQIVAYLNRKSAALGKERVIAEVESWLKTRGRPERRRQLSNSERLEIYTRQRGG